MPETVAVDRSRGGARRRRLNRGAARFVQATELDGYRVRSVAQLALTFDSPDYERAQGEIRRFWHEIRRRYPRARYFCWLELQRSGRLHYHALWLNPPPRTEFDLHQDVHRIWRNGRTRGRRVYPKDWAADSVAYVLGYAKKMGKKAYQQDYDQLPSSLRTFMSQRLGYVLEDLDHVRERYIVRFVAGRANMKHQVDDHLELLGQLVHPVGTVCQPRRGGIRRHVPPLLLRQPHTGLPGRTWREQRAFVVQAWLPRPPAAAQGMLTPEPSLWKAESAGSAGRSGRKLGDAAEVLAHLADVNTIGVEA